jgi:hypothetical protein
VTIADGSITDPVTPRNVVLTFTDDAGGNLAGTVTINGTDWTGRTVQEVHTVVTGTVSYAGSVAFKRVTSVVRNLGATGAAADTFAMGYGVKLGLPYNPDKQAGLVVDKLIVSGTAASTPSFTTANAVTGVTATTVNIVYDSDGSGTLATQAVVTAVTPASSAVVTGGTVATVSAVGTAEAAAATDATYGTFTATTAPNAARDYEVYYSFGGPARPDAIAGANRLKLSITGSTSTNDVKDMIVQLLAF